MKFVQFGCRKNIMNLVYCVYIKRSTHQVVRLEQEILKKSVDSKDFVISVF